MLRIPVLFIAVCFVTAGYAQEHFTLSMPSLKCRHTTEDGEDEIYQYIVYRKSDGTQSGLRLPIIPQPSISMNDGSTLNNDVNWGELLSFDLKPGERIDISGTILEQDDGTIAQYAVFPGELFRTNFFSTLQNGSTPTFQTVPRILNRIAGTNKLSNADDWIGTYMVSISLSRTGVVTTTFRANFNTNDKQSKLPSPATGVNKAVFWFGGDGSFYIADVRVIQSRK